MAGDLVYSAPPAEPPAGLKERLWQRIRGAPLTLLRAAAADWRESLVPGVSFRQLQLDRAQDRQTIVVRMAPGAVYPVHEHGGTEECYVIEGDLLDGSTGMTAGDYSRYEGGTRHGPLATERGCLLLVTSSLHDEIVAGPQAG